MKYVNFYNLGKDGSQIITARCSFVDDRVVCEGDTDLVNSLEKDGIICRSERTRIFPKDGLVFLEQLANNYKSAYLSATDVIEMSEDSISER